MFNMLVNLIFTIVAKIADLILSPLILAISSFIPGFGNFLTSILNFLGYGLTYFVFILKLFMIPKECVQIVITIAFASLSIVAGIRTYSLIVKIYNYFKP